MQKLTTLVLKMYTLEIEINYNDKLFLLIFLFKQMISSVDPHFPSFISNAI